MTYTVDYTRTHEAFRGIASLYDLVPFDVRVLVAVHERGGVADTAQVESDMCIDGSSVRRAMANLRDSGFIICDNGTAGARVKRGTRARLTLTTRGHNAAAGALLNIREQRRIAA